MYIVHIINPMTTCDRINIIWNCIPSFYINIIVIKKIGLLVSAYIKVTKIITLYYSELIFMWAYVCKEVVLFMTLNVIMLSIQTMRKTQSTIIHDFNERSRPYLNIIFLFYISLQKLLLLYQKPSKTLSSIYFHYCHFFNYLSKIEDKFILRINRCLFYYDLM